MKILILILIIYFSFFVNSSQIKRAAAFYPPPKDPHPQTGNAWICREFLLPKKPGGKPTVPKCKDNKIPGIYMFFTNDIVELEKGSGLRFPYMLDYIGKSQVSIYERWNNHKQKKDVDLSAIMCYMRYQDKPIPNFGPVATESSLLNSFAAPGNSPINMGYVADNTIKYDSKGLPFDILKTLYEMDLVSYPGNPPKNYIEGDEDASDCFYDFLIEKSKHVSKIVTNETKVYLEPKYPFFSKGIPYEDNVVLESKDFDKSCENNETAHFKPGDGKKHSIWKRVGGAVAAGVAAGAVAVGGAVAGAAGAAGGAVAGAAGAAGDAVVGVAEEGWEAWKDGADIIIHGKPH